MSEPTRSPLSWPHWFPRTPVAKRKSASFGTKNSSGWGNKPLTLHQACGRVLKELSPITTPTPFARYAGWRITVSEIQKIETRHAPSKEFRFFFYDPEGDGFVYFRSAEDRDAAAPSSIQNYLEDGWDESVTQIVAGELTHSCQRTNVVDRPPEDELDEEGMDKEGRYWQDSWEHYCDYELLPIK